MAVPNNGDVVTRTRRRWHWITDTIHNGAFTVIVLAIGLISIMSFQSWELRASQHHTDQERNARQAETKVIEDQSGTIKRLSDHIIDDERFFDLIRQLVLIGNAQTPEAQAQRQQIIQQLQQQAHDAAARRDQDQATTTTTTPPRGNAAPTTPTTRSPPQSTTTTTTPKSTTTTTTTTTTTLLPVPLPSAPCITVPIIKPICMGAAIKSKRRSKFVAVSSLLAYQAMEANGGRRLTSDSNRGGSS